MKSGPTPWRISRPENLFEKTAREFCKMQGRIALTMTPLLSKKMNRLNCALLLGVSLFVASATAAKVPAILPRPDMTPPSDGKVKVYILAGQSNMVGFGYLDDPGLFIQASISRLIRELKLAVCRLAHQLFSGTECINQLLRMRRQEPESRSILGPTRRGRITVR